MYQNNKTYIMKKLAISIIILLTAMALPAQNYSYELKIDNFQQVSESEFQFDIFIRKGTGSEDFALYMMQCHWSYNPSIVNGGNFFSNQLTIVGGFYPVGSELHQLEGWFNNIDFTKVNVNEFNWASLTAPYGGEKVTVISGQWLKVARFSAKLRNSTNTGLHNFSDADPQFAFVINGWNTIVRRCGAWEGSNPDALMLGEDNYEVPRAANGLSPALGVPVSAAPLAGYCMNTGTDWGTPANWNNTLPSGHAARNQLPGASKNALIGVPANISPSTQVTINNLVIKPTASLTLQSDATGTGSLIHQNTGVQAVVKRYIEGSDWLDWKDGWHFISSPVANQPISPAFTAIPDNSYDLYTWHEPANLWVNFKNNTEPPTWSEANSGSGNFLPGKGYMAAYQQTSTREFSGILNVEDVSMSNLGVNTGDNRSWHLLGNPFPCALNWASGWTMNNIGGVAQIWSELGQSYSPVNESEPIPATQGFMVRVSNGGSGAITIPSANRTHSPTPFYKNTEYPVIKLFAHNTDYPSFQESQVRFNPLSTEGFDIATDGEFIPGYAPRFYSYSNGIKLSVNSQPRLTSESRIEFDFVKNEGSRFRIEAQSLESVPATVWLFDKITQSDHNLTQNPVYHFSAQSSDQANRFVLHFSSVGTEESKQLMQPTAFYLEGQIICRHLPDRPVTIVLTDLTGRRLQQWVNPSDATLRLSRALSAGWYLLTISSNSTSEAIKVYIHQ